MQSCTNKRVFPSMLSADQSSQWIWGKWAWLLLLQAFPLWWNQGPMLPGQGCVSMFFYDLHFDAFVWLHPCRLTAWPLHFAAGNTRMWPILNRFPSRPSTPHVSSWQYDTEKAVNESLMLLPSITLRFHAQYSRINFAPIVKGSKWASSVLSNFNTNTTTGFFL